MDFQPCVCGYKAARIYEHKRHQDSCKHLMRNQIRMLSVETSELRQQIIRLDERLKLKDERIAELEAQLKAPKEPNKRPRTEEPVALNLFGKESLREREIEKRRKYI